MPVRWLFVRLAGWSVVVVVEAPVLLEEGLPLGFHEAAPVATLRPWFWTH